MKGLSLHCDIADEIAPQKISTGWHLLPRIVTAVPLRDVAIEPNTKRLLVIHRMKDSHQLARFVEDPQRDQSLSWHSEGDFLGLGRSRLEQRDSKNKCEHEGA
jgi:hypothetical protein